MRDHIYIPHTGRPVRGPTRTIQDRVMAARLDNVAPLHVAPMLAAAVVGQPRVGDRDYQRLLGHAIDHTDLFGTECGRSGRPSQ